LVALAEIVELLGSLRFPATTTRASEGPVKVTVVSGGTIMSPAMVQVQSPLLLDWTKIGVPSNVVTGTSFLRTVPPPVWNS
jgi:hypothetical protein